MSPGAENRLPGRWRGPARELCQPVLRAGPAAPGIRGWSRTRGTRGEPPEENPENGDGRRRHARYPGRLSERFRTDLRQAVNDLPRQAGHPGEGKVSRNPPAFLAPRPVRARLLLLQIPVVLDRGLDARKVDVTCLVVDRQCHLPVSQQLLEPDGRLLQELRRRDAVTSLVA